MKRDTLVRLAWIAVAPLALVAIVGADCGEIPQAPTPNTTIISAQFTSTCSPIPVGEHCTAHARAFGPNGGEIANPALQWSSGDTRIAAVSGFGPTGQVTGITPGNTTIRITSGDGTVTRTESMTVVPLKTGGPK